MIIPFFIPHSGCPHQCVFCNQKKITGEQSAPAPSEIASKITDYLRLHADGGQSEVAFYGGTFTALPPDLQRAYLAPVQPEIQAGRIKHIRISTRPDSIDSSVLALLREYHVAVVELGAQSMDDNVLLRSGRGHTAADTVNALGLLKTNRFIVGVQLMPGLPGDTAATIQQTMERVIRLQPDFVRLYPALVLKDTAMENLYRTGNYSPLSLDEAITVCKQAYLRLAKAGIIIVRLGLQPTAALSKPGTVLAGPYHPAFRQLVESEILLDAMRSALLSKPTASENALFLVRPEDKSAAIGQRRTNIMRLKEEFHLTDVRFRDDREIPRLSVAIME
ncbi:MAG TPA: radical SAM protein [Nitrospirota bacterium]|nr:radical SAM protein [Nitrospirota bacterium]